MLSNLFSGNIVSGTPVHKVFLTQFLKERKYLSPVVKQIGVAIFRMCCVWLWLLVTFVCPEIVLKNNVFKSKNYFTCCGENRLKTTMSMTQCGAYMYAEGKKKKSWATWDQAADDILCWIHGNILALISERVRWCCSMKTDTSESDVWNQIRQNGQQNQHVLALHALLTGVIPMGLTLWKLVFNACVCMFYFL